MQSVKLGSEVVILDSSAELSRDHKDKVIITGSPGSLTAGRYALEFPPRLIVFNDAGVGKDNAGIAALAQLEHFGIAAVTVAVASARIADAEDTWACGVISHVNTQAAQFGITPGRLLREALDKAL
jgi:uncharacterized protein YunC (DUF1805 family)